MTIMNEEKVHVLVVDDYAENVELLKELLTASGYEVTTAYDGEEALKKVDRRKPDLILLDIMMPKMDGYQVCEALRNKEETKEIPIIFVTANPAQIDQPPPTAIGFIQKPFSPSMIESSIGYALGAASAPPRGLQIFA